MVSKLFKIPRESYTTETIQKSINQTGCKMTRDYFWEKKLNL